MSYYTGKIKNAPQSSKCKCYKKSKYVKKWNELNTNKCNMCGKENGNKDHGHVFMGQSKKIYITPLCESCNNPNNDNWKQVENIDNMYHLDCECWNNRKFVGQNSRVDIYHEKQRNEDECCIIL